MEVFCLDGRVFTFFNLHILFFDEKDQNRLCVIYNGDSQIYRTDIFLDDLDVIYFQPGGDLRV